MSCCGHLEDQEAVSLAVAVEAGIISRGGRSGDAGMDLDLQLGLEAGHDGPVLLHVCAQDHLDHHLPQPHLQQRQHCVALFLLLLVADAE